MGTFTFCRWYIYSLSYDQTTRSSVVMCSNMLTGDSSVISPSWWYLYQCIYAVSLIHERDESGSSEQIADVLRKEGGFDALFAFAFF